jgi:hypothetical protein
LKVSADDIIAEYEAVVSDKPVVETILSAKKVRTSLRQNMTLLFCLFTYICLLQLSYFNLRNDDIYLYFVGFLDFDTGNLLLSLFLGFFVVLPILHFFLIKSKTDLFAFIYSPLMLIGGTSGVVVLSYSDVRMTFLYLSLYVVLPFLLLFVTTKGFRYPRIRIGKSGYGQFLLVGMAGLAFYIYLLIRLNHLLGLPSISEVYEFRSAFAAEILGWEKYAIPFSKYFCAFGLTAYAIGRRKPIYLIGALFIFVVDYMLAGNKSSLAFLVLSIASYYWFSVRRKDYSSFYFVVPLIVLLCVLNICYYFNVGGSIYVYGLYDRLFNVSSGLFVRYYEYANQFHFFGGGDGLLGSLLGGVPENYHDVIGEYYFSPGVSANADFISDGYINFGVAGSVIALCILRMMFSKADNVFYRKNRALFVVILLPYTISIFSMGLQTSLLTGGLLWALLLLKLTAFGSHKKLTEDT